MSWRCCSPAPPRARPRKGPCRRRAGFDSPTYVTAPASEPGKLYVVEQPGRIECRGRGRCAREPFLDIRSLVRSGGEQGLLSVAFHPRYAQNHLFYVDYTDTNGDTRVVEYRSDGTRADPSSARQLFFEKQPFPNHNGGQLAFGPDGSSTSGMGDGGSGGDPDNNGADFTTKLAKIWKIDVNAADRAAALVAYGLRNPWRFSFDRATGDLYIGDVGQDALRGDRLRSARELGRLANFGWAVYEGRRAVRLARKLDPRAPYPGPIQVYPHALGCSVTGGFVYRGKARRPASAATSTATTAPGTVWSLQGRQGAARPALRKEPFSAPVADVVRRGRAGRPLRGDRARAAHRLAS